MQTVSPLLHSSCASFWMWQTFWPSVLWWLLMHRQECGSWSWSSFSSLLVSDDGWLRWCSLLPQSFHQQLAVRDLLVLGGCWAGACHLWYGGVPCVHRPSILSLVTACSVQTWQGDLRPCRHYWNHREALVPWQLVPHSNLRTSGTSQLELVGSNERKHKRNQSGGDSGISQTWVLRWGWSLQAFEIAVAGTSGEQCRQDRDLLDWLYRVVETVMGHCRLKIKEKTSNAQI